MTEIALSWSTALVGLAVVGLLGLSLVLVSRTVRAMTTTTRVHCPGAGRGVVVQYLHDGRHRVSIVYRGTFPDPSMVTCGMSCLGAGGGGLQAKEDREAVAGLLDG